MIGFSSNIDIIIGEQLQKIEALKNNPDPVLRTVAMAVLPALRKRVHVDGKDSMGQQIGTYSEGYMVVRTGNFKDGAKFKRGDKKGSYKERKKAGDAGKFTDRTIRVDDQGVFSGEDKVGTNRPVYNRTADTKVIISLTRQMENDLSIIDTPEGYGIGYLNPDNFKKAGYVEQTYNKKILTQLTAEELELAVDTAQNFLPEYLKEI